MHSALSLLDNVHSPMRRKHMRWLRLGTQLAHSGARMALLSIAAHPSVCPSVHAAPSPTPACLLYVASTISLWAPSNDSLFKGHLCCRSCTTCLKVVHPHTTWFPGCKLEILAVYLLQRLHGVCPTSPKASCRHCLIDFCQAAYLVQSYCLELGYARMYLLIACWLVGTSCCEACESPSSASLPGCWWRCLRCCDK